jgi:hypothetical protein
MAANCATPGLPRLSSGRCEGPNGLPVRPEPDPVVVADFNAITVMRGLRSRMSYGPTVKELNRVCYRTTMKPFLLHRRAAQALVLGVALFSSYPSSSPAQASGPLGRRVGRLTAPPGHEALYGSLSPDGSSFVYEVIQGEERQLWLLDLAAQKSRPLTTDPGVHAQPAWSPDSRMIAYSRSQPPTRADREDDGLWVVDVETGVERPVYSQGEVGRRPYLERPSWTSNTTLMFWLRSFDEALTEDGFASEPWTVRLDGGHPTRLTPFPVGAPLSVSPDGKWVASGGLCCGGREPALFVQAVGDSSTRCLARPIRAENMSPAWAPDGQTLYFVSGSPADSAGHAYRIRRLKTGTWGEPQRIEDFGHHFVVSVSSSRAGAVALVVRPDTSLVGELWVIPAGNVASRSLASSVHACPKPFAAIDALVERSRLPGPRNVDVVFEVPQERLSFFTVTYGREQDWGLYQHATGLVYRGRIGWIVPERSGYTTSAADSIARATEWFPLRADDTFLMSERLLDTLGKAASSLGGPFREFLARNGVTPAAVLRRLMQDDPRLSGAVAQNQRLLDSATSWAELTRLAELNPAIAKVVLARPDVRDSLNRVYAMGQLPAYRASWEMQWAVRQRFRTFAPALLADPNSPEHMLLELFYSLQGNTADVALLRALYEHPGTRKSSTMMTFFAAGNQPVEVVLDARQQLPRFGFQTLGDAVLALARRVRRDSTLPAFVFQAAASFGDIDGRALVELYPIRGRDAAAERTVRQRLAGSRAAPLPLLRELAESLRIEPSYEIAAGLLSNRMARQDRRILTIIAGLDTTKARDMPLQADSMLHARPAPPRAR